MIEPEVAFATLNDIAALSQRMLRYLCKTVLDERGDDMEFFNQFVSPGCIERLEHIVASDFEMMSYTDAINALSKADKKFDFPVSWGLDLQSEHERYLAEELCKNQLSSPITPKTSRASTCALTTMAGRWQRWMCSPRYW
ncbi:asparaginyl tRNA synthetase [Legionella taurinensis]|nr:amino acid--tRNA ligase-related protein [Legionella taurinensis]STY64950.1 asparaginyl tRNA synthetase [Legionella taurinensis]